ncbi:L-rhamnose-binding lectin CSL2-like protein [Labeo rohita]|uniref:L-rhamnose-binding lectin CSL2-like protein n=1 Tax=Labeo rohita TaxID=84645 RepID=A0A498LDH7_LABRO|nr:L-rhamnose-binding lectin CSL2-like protein [Labeo rohita]
MNYNSTFLCSFAIKTADSDGSTAIVIYSILQCGRVEAYKIMLICEGGSAFLSCATGVISVDHANYGRRDLVTRPNKLATTPHCYSPQTRIMVRDLLHLLSALLQCGSEMLSVKNCSKWCDGKKNCSVAAVNRVFSDPCVNTYKYLEVYYACIKKGKQVYHDGAKAKRDHFTTVAVNMSMVILLFTMPIMDGEILQSALRERQLHQTVTFLRPPVCVPGVEAYKIMLICEGGSAFLSCATGVISVDHANYGRRDLVTRPNKLATTPHCYSPQTRIMVRDLLHLLSALLQCGSEMLSVKNCSKWCDGKKNCSVAAVNRVFSDPCVNTYKYLEVYYACIKKGAMGGSLVNYMLQVLSTLIHVGVSISI